MTDTVWWRFERVVKTHPDHVALIHGETSWSFADLHSKSLIAAAHLRQMGVDKSARVILRMENSPDMAAALLGTWAANGIPVLVHAVAPITHLRHAAKVTSAIVCVLDRDQTQLPEDIDAMVISVEELQGSAEKKIQDARLFCLSTEPASVVFTSGSTGLPKGVTQSHRNLLGGCDTVYAYLRYEPQDKIVCPIPWSFDYGYGQLLSTLCHGLTQILPETRNPFGLCAAIEKNTPSILPGIPSWFTSLFRGISPIFETDVSSIRLVTNTGGTIPRGVLDDMLDFFHKSEFVLNYGLTETYRSSFLPPELVRERADSIGKAIPGVDIVVVREDGSLAKPGEIGELVHRGNGIFLGYWGDEANSAKVLRDDPVSPANSFIGHKAVFTGDLGVKDEAGFLYYKGRRDHLIKSMGVRVSPGEVEALLNESGIVRDVAVFGLASEMIGEFVAVAVESLDSKPVPINALKNYARGCMSPQMQPREYFCFDKLPKTPSGKPDYPLLKKICDEKKTVRH